jgi:hypothetical protein
MDIFNVRMKTFMTEFCRRGKWKVYPAEIFTGLPPGMG